MHKVNLAIGILGQVWYLIVAITDLCTLTYFYQYHVVMDSCYNIL